MPVYFEQIFWFYLPFILMIISVIYNRYQLFNRNHHDLETPSVYLPLNTDQLTDTQKHKHSHHILAWLVIFLLSTSLAQPVSKTKVPYSPDKLHDIVFIIDTSVGMSIKDYSFENQEIDRLTLLKAVLINFINSIDSNRIGLMVYADDAYMLSPLTTDKNLTIHNINRIQLALAGRQNNISNALNSFYHYYKDKKSIPSVILVSQGANLEDDSSPRLIAEKFSKNGIKLHFIGLGSRNNTTQKTQDLIFDPINNRLLQSLADITGGYFFWAGQSHNLNSILQNIRTSETIPVKKSDYYLIENHYMWPLYLAAILILIELLARLIRLHK